MRDRLKVAIVGHVDHGKSTLIGRLLCDTGSVPPDRMERVRLASQKRGHETELAYLIDHFQEERNGEMTIDTAQVFFETGEREYVIIDAPGHREFLKNMLTGASQAQMAILTVDSREGVGEQTRRHAFLLNLLGLKSCVVAMNKMDLVDFAEARFGQLRQVLKQLLDRVGLECAGCVPISAKLGDNVASRSERMPWYHGPTLLDVLARPHVVRDVDFPTRFCIQDVYSFDGRRIAAGRVETGSLDAGQRLMALPDKLATEVLSIERFLSARTTAEPGECVGLTLPDDFPARRGQVLCDPAALPSLASTLTARLIWMSDQPLEKGDRLALKVATQETACVVEAIRHRIDSSSLDVLEEDAGCLRDTDVGHVQLAAASTMVAELAHQNPSLGRLVLERDGDIAAAGIIIGLE